MLCMCVCICMYVCMYACMYVCMCFTEGFDLLELNLLHLQCLCVLITFTTVIITLPTSSM